MDVHLVCSLDSESTALLHRIDHKLGLLLRHQRIEDMASKNVLDQLTATVTANTNATNAAKDALLFFAQSNADLTAKLQAAIAADDTDAVKAAADAIAANNASLISATPAVAAGVTANTPAA